MAMLDSHRPGDAEHTAFSAEVWQHPGDGSWHFITLPADLADETRARTATAPRPFGSVPVRATIGATSWTTSIFADRASGSYLLPVKASVRRDEGVQAGDTVTVILDLPG